MMSVCTHLGVLYLPLMKSKIDIELGPPASACCVILASIWGEVVQVGRAPGAMTFIL
jgi:hypothetical protein